MSTDRSSPLDHPDFIRDENAADGIKFLAWEQLEVLESRSSDSESIIKYQLIQPIGTGGTSEVYLAECTTTQSQVAIKVFKGSVSDDECMVRFRRENAAVERLQHDNIAKLLGCGVTSHGNPFIVFEYVNGESLDSFCHRNKVPMEDRIRLLSTICDALQCAHDQGIIHRDLKPSNVIVRYDGVPFLTDFGLSKLSDDYSVDAAKTRTGTVLGTLNYISPEALFPGSYNCSVRTDVFGLGAIMHVLLTDRAPFNFNNYAPMQEYYGQLPDWIHSNVPTDLKAVCLTCLSVNPDYRYSTAIAVQEDLERFLRGEKVHAKLPTLRQKYTLFTKRYPYLASGILLGTGCMVIALVIFFGLWRSAENNYRESNESRAQILDTMMFLTEHVRSQEDRPETRDERLKMMGEICATYQSQQQHFLQDTKLLYQSAVSDFKMADLQESIGIAVTANEFRSRAKEKFIQLLKEDPTDEKSALGSIQSSIWLGDYEQAAKEATELCQQHPENTDYLDTLCTINLQLGKLSFLDANYDASRSFYQKASSIADRLPKDSPDSRFPQKRARSRMASAQLAILDDDLETASQLVSESLQIYRDMHPEVLSTHGIADEYLLCLRFAMSIAAFREDIASAVEQFETAMQFYDQIQNRFSSYVQIHESKCLILADYVAICTQFGLDQKRADASQNWKTTMEEWEAIDRGSRSFLLQKLVFQTCPLVTTIRTERFRKTRDQILNASPSLFHENVGRAFLIDGSLSSATQFYEQAQVAYPNNVWIEKYLEVTQALSRNPDLGKSPGQLVVSKEWKLHLLAATTSFAATQLEAYLVDDLKQFRSRLK